MRIRVCQIVNGACAEIIREQLRHGNTDRRCGELGQHHLKIRGFGMPREQTRIELKKGQPRHSFDSAVEQAR